MNTGTMKTTIGKLDPATGTVPVRFEGEGWAHNRTVNAVLKPGGKLDRKATEARVAEVAAGVEHKFSIGALRAQTEVSN